jgi:transcriptional regulator with XRE-family HTH domain
MNNSQCAEQKSWLNLAMALKDRIKFAMEAAGLSPADLARATKTSPGGVSQWLDGKTKSLKAETAARMEKATGINARWIATGEGQIKASPDVVDMPLTPVAIQATDSRYCSVRQAINTLTILVEDAPANERKAIMHLINSALETPTIAPHVIDALKSLMASSAITSRVPMEPQVAVNGDDHRAEVHS